MTVQPTILCPVDFSTASAGALRYAASVAAHVKTRVMALAVDKAMKSPDVIDRLKKVGIEPIGGTRASFVKFVDEERARLGAVVKATGMRDE